MNTISMLSKVTKFSIQEKRLADLYKIDLKEVFYINDLQLLINNIIDVRLWEIYWLNKCNL